MNATICASFADASSAKQAVAALVDAGSSPGDLNVVSSGANAPGFQADQEFGAMTAVFPDLVGGQGSLVGDEAAYGMRYSGIAATANASVEPGNMTEYLWDSLPADMAGACQSDLAAGRTVVIVRNAVDAAQQILEAHGSSKVRRQEAHR